MKKQSKLMYAIVTAAAALLTGHSVSAEASQESLNWPEVDDAWLEKGTFVNVNNLRQVTPGMSKDQLYNLLGRPHFSTGLFSVREWNYIFDFRTGRGDEYVACQYKVLFDENYLAKSFHWKDAACEGGIESKSAVTPQPAVLTESSPEPMKSRQITLETDGLFRFGGGTKRDLLPQGHRRIQELVKDVRGHAKMVHSISVTGHTDRIGSMARNQELSLQRARTVSDILVAENIPAESIQIAGLGASQPVVQCQGHQPTPELIKCLQPNRRAVIEFKGE